MDDLEGWQYRTSLTQTRMHLNYRQKHSLHYKNHGTKTSSIELTPDSTMTFTLFRALKKVLSCVVP